MRKYKVSIYMDSGAVIQMECDKFSCTQNGETHFTKLEYDNKSIDLFSIDLTHVIAVTGIKNAK